MAEQKVTGHRILLRHRDIPEIGEFDVYKAQGGFETFKKVVTSPTAMLKPFQEVVKKLNP